MGGSCKKCNESKLFSIIRIRRFPFEKPLKTLSSAVHNAGMGWYRTFVNRHVDSTYNCDDVKKEMATYLEAKGFSVNRNSRNDDSSSDRTCSNWGI